MNITSQSMDFIKAPQFPVGTLVYYCDYDNNVMYHTCVELTKVTLPNSRWWYKLKGVDGWHDSGIYPIDTDRSFVIEYQQNLTSYSL